MALSPRPAAWTPRAWAFPRRRGDGNNDDTDNHDAIMPWRTFIVCKPHVTTLELMGRPVYYLIRADRGETIIRRTAASISANIQRDIMAGNVVHSTYPAPSTDEHDTRDRHTRQGPSNTPASGPRSNCCLCRSSHPVRPTTTPTCWARRGTSAPSTSTPANGGPANFS